MAEQMIRTKAQREQEQARHHERSLSSLLSFTSSSESSDKEDGRSDGFRQEMKTKWRKFRNKGSHSPSTKTVATSDVLPGSRSRTPSGPVDTPKPKMSLRLLSLLVYTVGVKCHGVGPSTPVTYAPEHMFSLSENTVNRLLKSGDVLKNLIQHTQKNLVRTYPKGLRVNSSNYAPHRYWAAGAQVAAINWQTFGTWVYISMFPSSESVV